MLNWLLRLVGAGSRAPAAAEAAALAQLHGADPNADTDPARAAAAAGFGQHRPLVGRAGRVEGFELRLPSALQQRLDVRQGAEGGRGSPALSAHFAALLAAGAALRQGGRTALVELPLATLSAEGVLNQLFPDLMLAVQAAAPDAGLLGALRARGVRVGVPDGPPERAPDADFVLLRATAGGIDTLLLSAQRWHEARPRLPRVALGLESVDDVERALAAGLTLVGGRFGGGVAPAGGRPLHAAAHRICALLNELALDRDTARVADAVRSDVALAYRVLRYANSPAIGLRRSVETVEDAVMLLGRVEFGRWLSVMLMSAVGGRQASGALQEDALARGRLLELLARARGAAQPQLLFTLGLLSRLHLLLRMPMATALEPLRLSDELRQALLQGCGPWADYLALADEMERDDAARFAALCEPFGGVDSVLATAAQAWAWAAEVTRADARS